MHKGSHHTTETRQKMSTIEIDEFNRGIVLSGLYCQISEISNHCQEKAALGEDTKLLLLAIEAIIEVIKKVEK